MCRGDGVGCGCWVGEFLDDDEGFLAFVGAGFNSSGQGLFLGLFHLMVIVFEYGLAAVSSSGFVGGSPFSFKLFAGFLGLSKVIIVPACLFVVSIGFWVFRSVRVLAQW